MKMNKASVVALAVLAAVAPVRAVAGGIASAVANRDVYGAIESVTFDIRVGQDETAAIFRLSGATAGKPGSTNGWENVEWVGSCAADTSMTFAVPDGWGATVKAMSFIVSDSEVYGICKSLETPHVGAPYINTGIIPTDKTRICIDYTVAKAGVCAFGITEMFYCFNTGGTTAYLAFHNLNNGGKATTLALSGKRTRVSFGSGAYDNGDGTASPGVTVEYDSAPASSFKLGEQGQVVAMDNTAPLTLFCRMTRNGTAPTKQGACTIYSARIYEDNKLVRDFVPICTPDGTAALFDRCSRDVYGSANSGTFRLGDSTGEFICDGQLRVIDKTLTYSADDEPVGTGVIRSAKANRDSDGNVMFVELSLAVPANQTNVLYCACGARAGADGSTNGWESVTQVGLFTADTMLRCPVPQGWGGVAKAMRFFLSDAAGGKWLPVYTSLASTANGGEYISTGVIPTDRTRICIDYYTASLDVCAFGLTDRFYYFEANIGQVFLGFQNLITSGSHYLSKHHVNVTFGSGAYPNADGTTSPGVTTEDETGWRGYLKLGEQSYVVNQKDVTSPISLFGRMTRDSTVLTKAGASAIYWAQLFENDLMVRDFVPVLDGDEGAMLDRCSGRLYYNAGGGALVLNTPTGEFQPTAIHVISASRTIRADPDGFMILLK